MKEEHICFGRLAKGGDQILEEASLGKWKLKRIPTFYHSRCRDIVSLNRVVDPFRILFRIAT
jgi:hypothetical protein